LSFTEAVETAGKALDGIGVAILLVGTLWMLLALGTAALRRELPSAYRPARQQLGRSILLGLEVLVAADIIRTVAIEPTLDSVAVLGGIVLVRTFLSFSLEVELEGKLPWRGRSGSDDQR
jgi:uncharacterized membrane protein